MQQSSDLRRRMGVCFAALLALSGCPTTHSVVSERLSVECVSSRSDAPSGAWICPDSRTIECSAQTQQLFFVPPMGHSCGEHVSVVTDGSLTLGGHTLRVVDDNQATLCSSDVIVRDTVAPEAEGRTLALWPPNHKMHSYSVDECVSVHDACDPHVQAEFIWASSDEPVDATGDGHFGPDIQVDDCMHLSLRAERRGPSDGRVYKLGVRAVDASGNVREVECRVVVAHDQSTMARGKSGEVITANAADTSRGGRADQDGGTDDGAANGKPQVSVASDEAYRLLFDGTAGLPACGRAGGTPESDAGMPESDAGAPAPQGGSGGSGEPPQSPD